MGRYCAWEIHGEKQRGSLFSGPGPVAWAAGGDRGGAGNCCPLGRESGPRRCWVSAPAQPPDLGCSAALSSSKSGTIICTFSGNPGGDFISLVDVFISSDQSVFWTQI